MAKKRKAKKIKTAVAKKVTVSKLEKKAEKTVTPAQAEHILGFAGGILVVIAAVVALLSLLRGGILEWTYLASLVLGVVMIALTWRIPRSPRVSAIFLLVLSIATLILPPNGFIVGPILGLIGAIIVLVKR